MDTDITYLTRIGEDLHDAAVRESLERVRTISAGEQPSSRARRERGPRAVRGPGRERGPRWGKLVAAAAAVLTFAAGIGYVATNGLPVGGSSADSAGGAGGVAASPAEGGFPQSAPAGGGWEQLRAVEQVEQAVPAPAALDESVKAEGGAADSVGAPSLGSDASLGYRSQLGSGIGDVSKIIKTADLSIVVAVDSFDAKFQDATEIAAANGGFLESSDKSARSGHLRLRVPASRFDATRRGLKALGIRVERETIQGQDVTAQFVDLKARLEILEARKVALQRLLRQANSLEEILRLNNVVDDVLTRIEELKGEIRLINDRSSMATIGVAMREEGVEPVAKVDTPSLATAWTKALAGFLGVIYAIVIGLGYLIPIAIVAGLAWLGVRSVRTRGAEA